MQKIYIYLYVVFIVYIVRQNCVDQVMYWKEGLRINVNKYGINVVQIDVWSFQIKTNKCSCW